MRRANVAERVWLTAVAWFVCGACSVSTAAAAGRPPSDRRNFIACPIIQDTETVPCWVADYAGERYFLGIQTDSGGWSPPWLGHKVLIEGQVVPGPRICGGIPLTSQYPATSLPAGTANGVALPNSPVASVMRELDPSCNTLLPTDPAFQVVGRRGPGPNTAESALRRPPPPPPPPVVTPPYSSATFKLTYDFDSELATRTIGEALKAVQYAQAVQAKRMLVVGYRGATLLSDGTVAVEIEAIARLRAAELGKTLRKLGMPPSTQLQVRWENTPQPADGVTDPERRRAEIVVAP
jgi:hypothetical protein